MLVVAHHLHPILGDLLYLALAAQERLAAFQRPELSLSGYLPTAAVIGTDTPRTRRKRRTLDRLEM
jgi:hypothetical protein